MDELEASLDKEGETAASNSHETHGLSNINKV